MHKNYHEVKAGDHQQLGRRLGTLFGERIRGYLAEEMARDDWPGLRTRASAYLDCTQQHFPQYILELTAFAESAGVDVLDLWTLSIEDELEADGYERCTTAVTNGGQLIGHNEDWSADAKEDICLIRKTIGATTTLELYYYACPLGGAAFSVRGDGYVQAINSMQATDHQIGVPRTVIARRLSEITGGDEEIRRVLGLARASGFAHVIGDAAGAVLALECTATCFAITRPVLPFVHTNHVLAAELQGLADDDDTGTSRQRYDLARRLVGADMQGDALKDALGRKKGKYRGLFNKNTIARVIFDRSEGRLSVWLRREKELGFIDYPILPGGAGPRDVA